MPPLTLSSSDRDDLSLAIMLVLGEIGASILACQRLGVDVRALDERRARYLALHRRVLGGES